MVLNEERLRSMLSRKRHTIISDYENLRLYREKLRKAYLDHSPTLTSIKAETMLQGASGAIPLEPFHRAIPLQKSFMNANEMKKWAADALDERIIIGIDGSQIYTSSDFNMPIGYVQVGSFWIHYGSNESTYDHDYLSDVYIGSEATEKQESSEPLHKMSVDQRRMTKEIELASIVVERCVEVGVPTYLMMDTPLLLRYIVWADFEVKRTMCKTMTQLLEVCKQYQVPLIGYTDYSLAKDITSTLEKFLQEELAVKVSDIAVVGPLLEEAGFGARTSVFRVQHPLLEEFYGKHRDEICFFYQKVHSDLPIRVELTLWTFQAGRIQEIAEVIAAQTVLGDGYPYVLLRAHEAALLDAYDRNRFYDIVSWFLSKECGVPFRETAKAQRKWISII